jgi:hypothetical protein
MGRFTSRDLGYSRVRRPVKFLALGLLLYPSGFLHILISQKANHQHSTLASIFSCVLPSTHSNHAVLFARLP